MKYEGLLHSLRLDVAKELVHVVQLSVLKMACDKDEIRQYVANLKGEINGDYILGELTKCGVYEVLKILLVVNRDIALAMTEDDVIADLREESDESRDIGGRPTIKETMRKAIQATVAEL